MLGRRGYQKGLQTFIWKADDPNDDDLSYDVLYRREGETTWKALKRDLSDPILVWDTTSVPNGTYVDQGRRVGCVRELRPAPALVAERESDTFDIDNAPPMITVATRRERRADDVVRFTVKDADSPVAARRVLARRRSLAPDLPEGRDRGLALRGVRAGAGSGAAADKRSSCARSTR